MSWHRLLLLLAVLASAACRRPPDPPTREHQLEELGLAITLPGDWRGGHIGEAYIFASGPADCSLTYDDGLVGIPQTEAGARAFLVERLGAVVDSTSALAFGTRSGVAAVGTLPSTPTTRTYFGFFPGPRGAVWTVLTTRGRPPATADALWRSVTLSVR